MSAADPSSALRRAAHVIQVLEARLAAMESARTEPIAIIGVGCRLPGEASDLTSLWSVLSSGKDTLGEVPPERFDAAAYHDPNPGVSGKTYVRKASFVSGVDGFDAAFFGISPREAAWIDPQHRVLLECAWQSLEHARLPVEKLRAARVGVYVGIGPSEYGYRIIEASGQPREGYFATGTGASFSAGRLSFTLGLRGPAVAVDTACSSSLVALHLACRALRANECELALAAGVQLMLSPEPFVLLSSLRALSSDGRCRTFSDRAAGYGRGEGCAVLTLKRLSKARQDGDRILAVVRGTAINHDGASSGLTTPNGAAQVSVLREALSDAGVEPSGVDYVEAHGTATALGDPIEVEALSRVYGVQRRAPLLIGSIKSNIGHLESAAGLAGVLKVIASLQRECLPASLNAERLNPMLDWAELPVQVVRRNQPWVRGEQPRRAGVSSFGMSGTNAHVILEEAPDALPTAGARAMPRRAELVVLSARSEEALQQVAGRLLEQVDGYPEQRLGDLAYSVATTRSLLKERLSLAVGSREELADALRSVSTGERAKASSRGSSRGTAGKVAWLFTGQGAQTPGMGRELYEEWPVFRQALDDAFGALDEHLERPLAEVMWAEPGSREAAQLDETRYTQPALFALGWALSELWKSWGVTPDFVAGHSVGELVAASVSGVLTLNDAARLVCARGRLMQALPPGGAMISIEATELEVREEIERSQAEVSVAAVNGRTSTVISGEQAAVLGVATRLSERGSRTKRLTVSHAFHSELMAPMLPEFRRVAEGLSYQPPQLALISNVTGRRIGGEMARAEYWVKHVSATVRFADGVGALYDAGARVFMELGPNATLLGLVAGARREDVVLLPSLRAGRAEATSVLEALGGWVSEGGEVKWAGVFPSGGRQLDLPTYPWQRRRHWVDAASPQAGAPLLTRSTAHVLLGSRLSIAGTDAVYESLLSTRAPAWLGDHRIRGSAVVPAAALAELVRAAVEEYCAGAAREIQALVLRAPLILDEDAPLRIQVILTDGGARALVYGQSAADPPSNDWRLHVSAQLETPTRAPPPRVDIEQWRRRSSEARDVERLYDVCRAAGLEYGPAFQAIQCVWGSEGEAFSEIALGPAESALGYGLHPILMDAALQTVAALLPSEHETGLVPFELGQVSVYRPGARSGVVRVTASGPATATGVVVDVTIADAGGDVIAELSQVTFRRLGDSALADPTGDATSLQAFHRLDWARLPPRPSQPALSGRWLVLANGNTQAAEAVVQALRLRGARSDRVSLDALRAVAPTDHLVSLWLDGTDFDAPAEASSSLSISVASRALATVQTLLRRGDGARLWWLTRAAVAVRSEEDVDPALASLWGFARSVMQEHPELRCTLLDIDRYETSMAAVVDALVASDDEDQLALRQGERFAARLVRVAHRALPKADNYRLRVGRAGALETLTLEPVTRPAPAAREVEIEVLASGLNFRDVLGALGMYPGGVPELGSECAGVVSRVGEGVAGLAVGDRVMALAAGTFGRYVTVDERLVASIPQTLSMPQAATLPIAFLTAWYALHDLGALQRGERLLVHAAAGGVGMAAVQVAQQIGATVLATASPTKWDVVRSLGAAAVANSRDTSFVSVFQTASSGADVVLNSLAGEFVDASLSLLGPGGRFLEMGKTDIREAAQLAAAHPGVTYRNFDLMEAGPDRIAAMFQSIAEGLASGQLRPLPVRSFAVTDGESAFRYMARAQHVGKIALLPARTPLTSGGSVLVTGGLGALGIEAARTLSQMGMKHLTLVGRRGLETPGAVELVAELSREGTVVQVQAADVSDPVALARAIDAVPPAFPLRGVVHAAGTLDDGIITQQTPERFERVMAAKVRGAANLDQLTRHLPLEFFVVFSSLAGTLGSAGQSGYAAANAYLDGLMAHRRSHGQPGTSLAWGPWSGVGMAASLDLELRTRIRRQGIVPIAPARGRRLLEQALHEAGSPIILASFDEKRLAENLGEHLPPIWRAFGGALSARQVPAEARDLRDVLSLPAEQRARALEAAALGEVSRVLSLGGAAQVPMDRSLRELGLDSLMAVELKSALSRRLGIRLGASFELDQSTLTGLVAALDASASGGSTVSAAPSGARASVERRSTATCEALSVAGGAPVRLFCFHDAGGSAGMFMPFAALPDVEVHAISHSRDGTPDPAAARDYLDVATKYVLEHADRPFAFFGHSLGSAFAWRVADELSRRGAARPWLFIPSSLPPRTPGAQDNAVDLRAMLEPILRRRQQALLTLVNFRSDFEADLALWDAMPGEPCPVLPIPILAVCAERDAFVSEAAMASWKQQTTLDFSLERIPGDHFYVHQNEQRALLLARLSAEIHRLVRPAAE